MVRIRSIYPYIPRRYRACLFIIFISCACIFFIYTDGLLPLPSPSSTPSVKVVVEHTDDFILFDDDDMSFKCPAEIQFNKTNRQHLAIIVTSKLVPFVWKNFRALLCSGVETYVMLDTVFLMNSSSRADGFQSRTNRSRRSYTHRFLYVKNEYLAKFGVRYMKALPSVEYTAWDRTIVWLYHRRNFTNAWIIEHDVQWYDVRNMTYLFDRYNNDTTDILCDNIVPTKSYWQLWPKSKSDIFPEAYWIGTFNPLVRWSRRLLQHHYRYMQLIHQDRLKYELNRDFLFKNLLWEQLQR